MLPVSGCLTDRPMLLYQHCGLRGSVAITIAACCFLLGRSMNPSQRCCFVGREPHEPETKVKAFSGSRSPDAPPIPPDFHHRAGRRDAPPVVGIGRLAVGRRRAAGRHEPQLGPIENRNGECQAVAGIARRPVAFHARRCRRGRSAEAGLGFYQRAGQLGEASGRARRQDEERSVQLNCSAAAVRNGNTMTMGRTWPARGTSARCRFPPNGRAA